ncbi:MAG: hypothetical protein U0441_22475 [Polyangiaceae bacterium]
MGTEKWRPLGAHEPFAEAIQAVLAAAKLSRRAELPRVPWWIAAILALIGVAAVVTATFGVLSFVRLQALAALAGERVPKMDEHLRGIDETEKARVTARFVELDKVELNCLATNNEINCFATNRTAETVQTCLRGKLTKKQANALAVYSLPLCTGRLEQFETRSFSAPWKGAFAKDLCNSKSAYGNELLDWNECDFTTEPIGAL